MSMQVTGVKEVVAALTLAETKALPVMAKVVEVQALALQTAWRAAARASSGKHGRRYPASITTERKVSFGSVGYEIGPEIGKPQGGMGTGFELGSRNQPPHLDMKHTADAAEPKFFSAVEAASAGLL